MTYEAALTDPEYDTPGKSHGLFDVFRHRYLLSLLLKKGIATRYYGSVLGWIWSYVRPAAQFLMYYLVIGVLLQANRGMDYFPVYLFGGIITVNLFSEALRNTTNAITDNGSLVKKIYLPRELFPVAALGSAFVHFLPQAGILLVVSLFLGWTISWLTLLAFIVGIVVVLLFSLGLGLFFGAINVAYRDARNVVDLILMFATWASPVLYSSHLILERAPEWVYNIYMVNPVTTAVELMHNVFWLPLTPDTARPEHLLLNAGIGLAIALGTVAIGQLTFRKMEGNFAQHL
ncbi:ABC-2 type transport system permease protein [Leucobacter luti]|uniref:ABC transporter permease n=1 Tax=Leucobacter luti TaxID=340320 RepID=UPI0010474F1F|nr:ABC transporter permease [Leucobacter luti]MCW2289855.1 ABC-2 type transport system permease protein [Leucobacter luti]TCK36024.1 ABC-2 type transport system permease protein [Leucobacter luti]